MSDCRFQNNMLQPNVDAEALVPPFHIGSLKAAEGSDDVLKHL